MFKKLAGVNDHRLICVTANTLIYAKAKALFLMSLPVTIRQDRNGPAKSVAVGHAAKQMLGRTPGNIS